MEELLIALALTFYLICSDFAIDALFIIGFRGIARHDKAINLRLFTF